MKAMPGPGASTLQSAKTPSDQSERILPLRSLSSDDGSLTGGGVPWLRCPVCGPMTTAGRIGHTLPFLIPRFRGAMSAAIALVAVELAAISSIRHSYLDTPFLAAALQVVVGASWSSWLAFSSAAASLLLQG